MVYQTLQIMDIQKTKAKCKTPSCIFSTKEHPECCRFFPLSFPSSGRRGSSWQHVIQTLALIVSCCWDSTIYEPSTPRSCFILASPSLPNFMPLDFHSTINLLLCMEMSRSWWWNSPLAWEDHFFSAISPRWAWQSYSACPVKWSWCNPKGTRVGGNEDLSLASMSVLDWALQGWRHSAFSPC